MFTGVLFTALGLTFLSATASQASGTAFNPYPGQSITATTSVINKTSETTVAITDIQVSAPNSTDYVPVQLTVDSGSLSFGSRSGLTFTPSGTTSGAQLNFAGTRAAVNAALATLIYTKGGSDSVNLTAKLWDSSREFTCSNGHMYRFVSSTLSYSQAKSVATSAFGGNGYLVTPTTDAENTCVYNGIKAKSSSSSANITWIGAVASYSSPTVTYTWDGGPEQGTAFWTKTENTLGTSGTPVGGAYAKWDLETINSVLTYQPNATVSGSTIAEPCVVYYKATNNDSTWHDVTCTGPNMYVIEGDNPQLPTASVALNFNVSSPSSSPSPSPSTSSPTALAETSSTPVREALVPIAMILFGLSLLFFAIYRSRMQSKTQ